MAEKPSYAELEGRIKGLEEKIAGCEKREEILRAREEKLSQIIHNISIPLFAIDRNHLVTHYNKALENLTGISAEKVIGTRRQWAAFYAWERPVMADLILDNAPEDTVAEFYKGKHRKSQVKTGAYEAEDFFPDLGPEGKWLYFTASPLKDSSEKITGAVETLQDITERKKAEEALRESEWRFKNLLDFVPYPIVVFSLDGRVSYLNPMFTEIFGWSLDELRGRKIPYVPPELEEETGEHIRKLFEERIIPRLETKRLTKDGRLLDVIMRGAIFSDREGCPEGELIILRDVTQEKKIARHNQAMFRISTALPEYPDLEDLLDYISGEVKHLMGSEGGLVVLVDEMRQEIFFPGAAYDDTRTQKRIKEIRLDMAHMDQVVAEKVIKTGEPIIINDTSKVRKSYPVRDEMLGYQTRSFIQVPLKIGDRIIGALTAINKKEGEFDQKDLELLGMIAGTVALSIENARFSEDVKQAYREVTGMNRAKDKVINHLSHELKTPLAVLYASLVTLSKRLKTLPEESWKPTVERAKRNLERLLEIQYQVDDIMQDRSHRPRTMISGLLDRCADLLEALAADELGEGPVVERIGKRVEEIFAPKASLTPEKLELGNFVEHRLRELAPLFSHRDVEIVTDLRTAPAILIPPDVLGKIFDGLFKNAIENTPDEGRIEIRVRRKAEGTELLVHDYGVGITEENKRRIFEGFFTTRETMDYSSKRPFDFNAGGKGADLLRMKIFSERYNFGIEVASSRCRFIPGDGDLCPGRISKCPCCSEIKDCLTSGETTFSITFPPAP